MAHLIGKMELVDGCNGIPAADYRYCAFSGRFGHKAGNRFRSVGESFKFKHADRPVPYDGLCV